MTEDTSIEDAFNHLVNTGKGAIVVKMTDGARIFPAQHLHLQLPGEASKVLARGCWRTVVPRIRCGHNPGTASRYSVAWYLIKSCKGQCTFG